MRNAQVTHTNTGVVLKLDFSKMSDEKQFFFLGWPYGKVCEFDSLKCFFLYLRKR